MRYLQILTLYKRKSMFKSIYSVGAIIKIRMSAYYHYAVVSDRYYNGKPMLISLSARQGTVCEEDWDYCVGDRKVVLSDVQGGMHPQQVVHRARSQIGVIKYNLLGRNCEHFARWVHELKVESKQVQGALLAAGLVGACYYLTKKA